MSYLDKLLLPLVSFNIVFSDAILNQRTASKEEFLTYFSKWINKNLI